MPQKMHCLGGVGALLGFANLECPASAHFDMGQRTMGEDSIELSNEEIALRMNNAVRRALNTPPKSHGEMKLKAYKKDKPVVLQKERRRRAKGSIVVPTKVDE
jgi:hypothetical protein